MGPPAGAEHNGAGGADDVVGPSVAAAVGEVRRRIEAACARAGRAPRTVTLVGVSKFQPIGRVEAAVRCGLLDLAENRAQDLVARVEELGDRGADVRWHFVGALQRNKTRAVAEVATSFHALDRLEVAERLSAQRPAAMPPLEVYVEVNVAGEASKAGIAPAEVGGLVDAVRVLERVRVVGLMAMPPAAVRPEDSRRWFAALRELAGSVGLRGLSMGTSGDFEVAVEEGATAVRIGRQLFGDR